MTKKEGYWCDVFSGLAWRAYSEPRLESIRSLNAINYVEIAANLEYR